MGVLRFGARMAYELVDHLLLPFRTAPPLDHGLHVGIGHVAAHTLFGSYDLAANFTGIRCVSVAMVCLADGYQ